MALVEGIKPPRKTYSLEERKILISLINKFQKESADEKVVEGDTKKKFMWPQLMEEYNALVGKENARTATQLRRCWENMKASLKNRENEGDNKKALIKYGSEGPSQSCMNVRYNALGTTILALRRRLPPILYSANSPNHVCQFDHPGYYNSCTMKSCFFAGNNDEYVLSGSDDFNLYLWKVPTDGSVKWVESAHMVLRGHRSIVNQVRYNPTKCIIASSGVEKIIKLWSPFAFNQDCLGGLKKEDAKEDKQRRVFSHDEYISLVIRSGQFMTHDYSQQSTAEDPRMMAFFDSLVQREIEGWNSEDNLSSAQSPSDAENVSPSDRSSSPSEDSESDDELMLNLLSNARQAANGIEDTQERPAESPNQISRLIANCRDKLMRLAALASGTIPVNGAQNGGAVENTAEGSTVAENAEAGSSHPRSKNTPESKGTKRKHRSVAAKLKKALIEEMRGTSGSDVDGVQPSTSSGSKSKTPRSKLASKFSSSSSSEDEAIEESDDSQKQSRKRLRSKRLKIEHETKNGNLHKGESTPDKGNLKAVTSDSGITSEMSTNEKCSVSQVNKIEENASDEEIAVTKFRNFKKKVDSAKRNYRKRTLAVFKDSSSDSSD